MQFNGKICVRKVKPRENTKIWTSDTILFSINFINTFFVVRNTFTYIKKTQKLFFVATVELTY